MFITKLLGIKNNAIKYIKDAIITYGRKTKNNNNDLYLALYFDGLDEDEVLYIYSFNDYGEFNKTFVKAVYLDNLNSVIIETNDRCYNASDLFADDVCGIADYIKNIELADNVDEYFEEFEKEGE